MSLKNETIGNATDAVVKGVGKLVSDPVGFGGNIITWLISTFWWIISGSFFFVVYTEWGEPIWKNYVATTSLTVQPNPLIYFISFILSIGGSVFAFLMFYFIVRIISKNKIIRAGAGAVGVILLWIFIQFPLVEFNEEVKTFSYALQMMQNAPLQFVLILLSVVFSMIIIYFVFFMFTRTAVGVWRMKTSKSPYHVETGIARPYAFTFMMMWVSTWFFQRKYAFVMFPLFVIGFLLQKAMADRMAESQWEDDFADKINTRMNDNFGVREYKPKQNIYKLLGVIIIILTLVLVASYFLIGK